MTQLILLAIAVVVVVVVLAAVAVILQRILKTPKVGGKLPFVRCDALFTPAERSFFGVLSQVVGDRHLILGKIRLADIIKPQSGLTPSERTSAFNRISGKHVDFVLCDRGTLSVAGVIELDDKSHAQDRRKNRDAFLDGALAAAGIRVLHVRAQQAYNTAEVKAAIATLVA